MSLSSRDTEQVWPIEGCMEEEIRQYILIRSYGNPDIHIKYIYCLAIKQYPDALLKACQQGSRVRNALGHFSNNA